MKPFPPYRVLIYAGTLITGTTGLVYQVAWQKYLSFVVGSEARSVALVVATFLAGLAAGYRFWGRLSERRPERRRLLRLYGLIEIGIGVWAAMFPWWIELVRQVALRAPASLLTDLLASAAVLFLPTFLMGATIPLLVSVVPERTAEVHLCHAKIYGINTLGACVGAFAASFYLIPTFGLPGALRLGSAANLAVGLLFVLNPLRERVVEREPIESIPNRFGPRSLYLYTLVTGTIALSFEVLFVRVLNLTIGAGPHNFAIVVGVFIFGLALGSLLLTERLLTLRVLFAALTALIGALIVAYYSVPYWPYWMSNVRVALRSLPVNHDVYLALVTGFLCLMLLPFLVPLGTMLPLVYALLPKDAADYGKKCGWLYFYNTLGTALGAVVLSHLLLHVLDLDQVFKIDVALAAALAVHLMLRERRRVLAAVVGLAALAFVAGPRWDRGSHYVGLFRSQDPNPFNFQGLFLIPLPQEPVSFFDDGPDSTVSVVRYVHRPPPGTVPPGEPPPTANSAALVINGKADGDTLTDYSTIVLAAILPYLHAPHRSDLAAAVIGMGTGTTAGLLAQGRDVARLTVVEISSTLVDALPEFDGANFGLRENPKVRIVDTDGFKYFARLGDRLDVVVSATSPPWVVGVENLFTPEFYRLAHDSLADDGVFLQWFPLYTMDAALFRTVLANVASVFPRLRLYQISSSEMGILAAKSAGSLDAPRLERFDEPTMREARLRMELREAGQLELIRLYDTRALEFLLRVNRQPTHTLSRPSLAYASDVLRFVNAEIDWDRFTDTRLQLLARYSERRRAVFLELLERLPQRLRGDLFEGQRLFADRWNELSRDWRALGQPATEAPGLGERLAAYDRLRLAGLQPPDPELLGRFTAELIERRAAGREDPDDLIPRLVLAHVKDGLWDAARRHITSLADGGVITEAYLEQLTAEVDSGRRGRERFVQLYGD